MDAKVSPVEWRDVPGWPGYRASSTGLIQSCRSNSGQLRSRWKTRKPRANEDGYLTLTVHHNRKTYFTAVHILVCLAFHGPRPDGAMALHKNGDRRDNRSDNLRWGTAQDNADDREQHGNTAAGERNGRAVIGELQVMQARRLREFSVPFQLIGEVFGISKRQAMRVCKQQAWLCVPPDNAEAASSARCDAGRMVPKAERV